MLDQILAIQAAGRKPLPKQLLPFDHNDGAGFGWANPLTRFTRNVAAECDEYGCRFNAVDAPDLSMTLDVPRSDGTRLPTDLRTLPFARLEGNEAQTQRRDAFNFGGFSSLLVPLRVW